MMGRALDTIEPESKVEAFHELTDDEIGEVAGGTEISGGAFGHYVILSADSAGWGCTWSSSGGTWAGGGTW